MEPIFADKAAWAVFQRVLQSWLGTPYRHLQAAKGHGADCTLFVGSALVEAGYMTHLSYDYYPRDWHMHTDREFVLESSHRHFDNNMVSGFGVQRFEPDEVEWHRGDMVAFKTAYSRTTNHAGVVMGTGEFINAAPKRGVCLLPLTGAWMRRATAVFRFVRNGEAV